MLSNVREKRSVAARDFLVGGDKAEVLPLDGQVAYLGKQLTLNENHHEVELEHRIARGWAKFMAQKTELCNTHYSHRLHLFNAIVTPSVLYGSKAWAMTKERRARLRTEQRRMLRKVLGSQRRTVVIEDDDCTSSSSEAETSFLHKPRSLAAVQFKTCVF